MKKTSFIVSVLALSSFAFASGKSYEVTISKPSKAGSVQLVHGTYKLKVDGDKAIFTDAKHHDFRTQVKVQNAPKKFQYTAVDSTETGGTDLVHSITLGGSTTKVEFGE